MTIGHAQGDPEVVKQLGVGKGRKARKWLVRAIVFVVLAGIVGAVVVWRVRAGKAKPESWVTEAVEQGDLRETVAATGTLSPLDAVEVGAEVTGRVLKVHVDINDQVKEGQVLVEIDPETLKARVDESQAQVRSSYASQKNSKATVKEAEAKAVRTRELHKRGLASDQDLEAAEAALDRAKASVGTASASVTVAQAGLKSATTAMNKSLIRSPIDGVVLARSVEPGQTVTAGFQTPILFTLAKGLAQMQLEVDIDEADVGKVKAEQTATFVVDAYPKRRFRSKVLRLNNLPKAGSTVITYEALLTVDNQDLLLRPGMTASATIVTSQVKDVLTVPNTALRFTPPKAKAATKSAAVPIPGMAGGRGMGMGRGGGGRPQGSARPASSGAPGEGGKRGPSEGVYVVKDGKAVRVPVEVGVSDGQRTEVRSPELSAGTQVIVDVEEVPK